MAYHYKILLFTLRANITDFVRTKGHRIKLVPFNEDYVNCDQERGGGTDCDKTKSNWRYDHRSFDAI